MESKMKVEIWSDTICPFCYIGKRKFESALDQFENKDNVEIIWKSFQLDPGMADSYDKSTYELVAKKYNLPLEKSKAMHDQLVQTAKEVGLDYNFDTAKPTNTLKAHLLIHFAKERGKQDAAEEALFKAYFTEGKNLNDLDTLVGIGASIGLDKAALKDAIQHETHIAKVNADINEAHQIGVRGVPFFVMNRKYGVSGAQAPRAFLETLEKSFTEWRKENLITKLEVVEGNVCTPGGDCN